MSSEKLVTLEITMKSGAKVELDVVDATYKYSMGSKTLEWTTPADWDRKLLHIDMDEVVAVMCRKRRWFR